MQNITHRETQKPVYDAKSLASHRNEKYTHEYQPTPVACRIPVVFDIETTAINPQRPILISIYDTEANELIIAAETASKSVKLSIEEIERIAKDELDNMGIEATIKTHSTCKIQILERVLNNINEYNQNQLEKHSGSGLPPLKTLTAHNMLFDLGVYCSEGEKAIDLGYFSEADFDGVIACGKYQIGHYKAGAMGRIYSIAEYRESGLDFETEIPITDTQTVAKALWKPTSLQALSEYYSVAYHQEEEQTHGKLTEQYLRYNINDTLSTFKCFIELQKEVNQVFGFGDISSTFLPLDKIYSTASIGKSKMKQMGYNRVNITEQARSICSKSYFGGQTEALRPNELVENVAYTDFLSQYPTISALTNCWESMQKENIDLKEISPKELPQVSLSDLQHKSAWEKITGYYVAIEVNGMTELPVRTELNDTNTTRVYKAKVENSNTTLIYNYIDVIGTKIRGFDDFEVNKAWKITETGKQELYTSELGGVPIDGNSNLMKEAIERRKKKQIVDNGGEKDENTLALKITANSLYGVTAERITQELGENQEGKKIKRDECGTYCNPHVASTITAGGRLLLTIGEEVAKRNNGMMYYCDTDSLIIDSHTASEVCRWFSNLNPYTGVAGELDLLEIEEKDGKELDNVDLFALDTKKYAIIEGKKIVDFKEHGLGHYEQLRESSKIKRLWSTIIQMNGIELSEKQLYDKELSEPLTIQQSATTARLRRLLSQLHPIPVRYGDFMRRLVTTDDTVYIGLDLDNMLYISENEISRRSITDCENPKTISNVVTQMVATGVENTRGRPTVNIKGTKEITKEATDILEIKQNEIQEKLPEGAILAIDNINF